MEVWQPEPGELVRIKSLKAPEEFGVVVWSRCSKVSRTFGIIRVFASGRVMEFFLSELEET